MTTPRIPKRLNVALGCYYALPDETPAEVLLQTELLFRRKYGDTFKYRITTYFFFEFPHVKRRDAFLATLETSCKQAGIPVERGSIF